MKNRRKENAEQQNRELTMQAGESRPLKDLNLIDDYMFDLATMDLETCKSIVELSLGIRIREIRWKEGQKVIHNLPGKRGIRLDFYVRDADGKVFNVEMQKRKEGNLPMRTRYYSALLDAPLLKCGEKRFDGLPETYIIVICGFDLFGAGKYRYRFRYHCEERLDLVLQNGLNIVFLNTRGSDVEGAEPELVAFLRFVENSTAEEARQSEDHRIQEMYGKINTLKNSEAVEVDYMTAEEYKRRLQEEAMEHGWKVGLEAGRKAGLEAGRKAGLEAGRKAGLEAGRKAGLEAGLEAGKKAGLEAGRKAGLEAGLEAGKKVGLEIGKKDGMELGKQAGLQMKLVSLAIRKLEKGYTPEQTADLLEEDPELIRCIYKAAQSMAPKYDVEKICDLIDGIQKNR